MIKVVIYEDREKVVKRLTFSGHAEYAEKGTDIVCSAVSVLFINTVNSIENFTKDNLSVRQDKKKNRFDISFLDTPSKESELLLKSLMLGLNTIRDQYGSQYLQVTLKEV